MEFPMNKTFLLIITSLITFIPQIYANDDYKITYERSSSGGSQISFELKDFKADKIETDGTVYTNILFGSKVSTNKKGFAELPLVSAAVQVSNEKNVRYDFIVEDVEVIELENPLLPSRGALPRSTDISSIPYEISESSIFDGWYPEKNAEGTEPFIFRDTRGMNIIFYPFRYNSAKQKLEVVRKITVKITENNDEPVNAIKRSHRQIAKEMDGVYRSLYINYNESKSLQIGDIGEILVIHTENNGGLSAIQPYIDWKKQLGYKVHALEVANGTDLNISQTVTSAYESNPNILFVQLIGDWENLKSDFQYYSVTSSDGAKDPVLGCVAGYDRYQDVIIGRFSVKSETELKEQIGKSMRYEKQPDIYGEWYTKALAMASNEGAGSGDDGESDQLHNEIIINNKLLPSSFEGSYEVYQAEGGNAAQISAAINAGVSLINYTGHGYYQEFSGPRFTSSNVSALTNGEKLPIVISVACLTGHFSYATDCFAETWLKKTDGGAVAGWFSTISQPWLPPMRGQDYFNDILTGGYDYSNNPGNGISTDEQRITFGALTLNSAILMLTEAPSDGSTIATAETWTVFGDAALQVRRDKPKVVEILNETLLIENYSTKITSGGVPVEGAVLTLFQNDSVFSGISDAEGNVSVPHDFTVGDVIITVSGFNLAPAQITVPVVTPEGAYLKVTGYSFSSSDFAQTATVSLKISNLGTEQSDGVYLSISENSDYLSIINGVSDMNDLILEPGADHELNGVLELEVSPFAPDQSRTEINAQLRDGLGRIFDSRLYLTINSPKAEVSHTFDTESAIQGQNQTVTFRIKNAGHAALKEAVIMLEQITDFDITISEQVSIDLIQSGEYTDATFVCGYGNDIINSSFARFKLKTQNFTGFYAEYEYGTVVGMTESFESGDFSKNEWVFSGRKNWIIDSTNFYEGGFSANSGDVLDGENSSISLTFNFESDGYISFYRKVSSELTYDRLSFYIDGILKNSWSGNLNWTKVSYNVQSGTREFKWVFLRDSSSGWGENKAWIDNILAAGIATTGIDEQNSLILPEKITLFHNYPNPFNPVTQIRFALAEKTDISLNVYNTAGQKVAGLASGTFQSGSHTVDFDGGRLNSGVYYYTLEADGKALTKKMILLK
jgi:hypothetical protein